MTKIIDKRKSIGDVAKELGLETHIIRFWESKFPQIKPQIGKGGRRYYFDKEIALLSKIKSLLYDEGYSIAGLQKLLKKRKDSSLKEQNIESLLAGSVESINLRDDDVNNIPVIQQTKGLTIDDFTNHNSTNSNQTNPYQLNNSEANLKSEIKVVINKLITQIEFNLAKIDQ